MRLRAAARLRTREADVWLVVLLVLVATVIRLLTIDNQSLWADEALTAYETHLPFGAMITTILHVETTPPLYFLLEWAWAHVFGTGAVSLRMISTLAGIALVPIAYLAARELVSRSAGVLTAAFVTVNPFMIWYSQEARSYMLLAALTGAGFLYFARSLREPSRKHLAVWVLLSAAAVMTHFFAGFAVAPEALWLLLRLRGRSVRVAVGIVAAAQLAVVPFAVADTGHGVGWIANSPRINRIADTALEWGISTLLRRATIAEGVIGGALLTAAVAALILRAGDERTRSGAAVAALVAAFVFLVPLALAFTGRDYVYSRNLIPAFLPVVVVIAAASTAPRAKPAGAALAAGLLVMFAAAGLQVQTHPYLQRPNWQAVPQALGPATVPRAILASSGDAAQPLKIYLPGVSWVQHHGTPVLVAEIDVVGARKQSRLLVPSGAEDSGIARHHYASTLPSTVAPPGTQLLARFRVDNWVVARFALVHPARLSINQLTAIAPRYFEHTPAQLLVFMQPRSR